MKIYSRYAPPPRPKTLSIGPSLTQQQEAQSCDINYIIKRYRATGVLPLNKATPIYCDVSEVSDYARCLTYIQDADARFLAIPADIRQRLGNSPDSFAAGLKNPDNYAYAVEHGLIAPSPAAPVAPTPTPTESAKADI